MQEHLCLMHTPPTMRELANELAPIQEIQETLNHAPSPVKSHELLSAVMSQSLDHQGNVALDVQAALALDPEGEDGRSAGQGLHASDPWTSLYFPAAHATHLTPLGPV